MLKISLPNGTRPPEAPPFPSQLACPPPDVCHFPAYKFLNGGHWLFRSGGTPNKFTVERQSPSLDAQVEERAEAAAGSKDSGRMVCERWVQELHWFS